MSATNLPELDKDRDELLKQLAESDISDDHAEAVKNLLSKDFMLAKIDGDGHEYLRLLAENIAIYSTCEFPPEDSIVQGDLAGALLEDESESSVVAMRAREKDILESALLTFFTRSSRSVSGWQQDKLGEQIFTQRSELVENNQQQQKQGILSRVFK
jgi:hypothetical protein